LLLSPKFTDFKNKEQKITKHDCFGSRTIMPPIFKESHKQQQINRICHLANHTVAVTLYFPQEKQQTLTSHYE